VKQQLKILSVHPRRHHNFEQALELYRIFDDDFKHVTGLFFPQAQINQLGFLGKRVKSALLKRSFESIPPGIIYTLPLWEIYHALIILMGRAPNYLQLNRKFQESVARKFAPPDVLICYDTSAAYLFRKWKAKTFCILDLTIGLPQYRLLADHGDKYDPSMEAAFPAYEKEIFAQYIEETSLADLILCGSEFVKQTCLFFGVPREKCVVLNYGVDAGDFSYPNRDFSRTRLKFAFVGILGFRKGVDLLLKVWMDFIAVNPGCEIHFFGEVLDEIPPDSFKHPSVFIHGKVPKEKLINYLKDSDVFVFPTTFEGSSYALYQAMAMQLPIITTLNSGTVIENGVSGIIINTGDAKALLDAMQKIIDHPDLRKSLATQAFVLSKAFTWENYGKNLGRILKNRIPSLFA
jgi:glycosyltransferase involved in cell wall biosynthesis